MAERAILVVDNHDSFVHTLVGYLRELGADCRLIEADAVTDPAAAISGYAGVLVSPGPGTPARAGASVAIVRAAMDAATPMLGVCLGHQALAEACGARVSEAPQLRHGLTSSIRHDGSALFAGLPDSFAATRYHSLAVEPGTLPRELRVTAWTKEGVVMGLAHTDAPAWGVQFHPESVLTEGGYRLLGNWLERAGVTGAAARASGRHPLREIG